MRHLERQQWIIIGLCGLIVAGFVFLRFYPLMQRSAEIREVRRIQETDVARVRECAIELPVLRRRADALRQQTRDYARSVPENRQFAELWQQIADVMNRYSLTEQIVQPGKENIGRTVNSIPITIQCAGSFDQLFEFLGALRHFDRVVRIEKCRLANDSDFAGRLKLNASAVVYYQNYKDSDS